MENSVIKTAGRVFEVLEYFREIKQPLSVREISEHFAYPLSSTSVLVKSLATLGYLSYDQKIRAYFPTIRVAALGEWIYESMFNGGELKTMLNELSALTNETVVLAVQNDIYAQYVHVIPSRQPIQFYISPGTRRLLCMSGTGWALLSQQSDETIEKIYHRTRMRMHSSPFFHHVGLDDVMANVRETRKKGYAFSKGTTTPGAGVIAVPLPVAPSGTRLAVGIAGIIDRLEAQSRPLLKALHTSVSHYAGQHEPEPRKAVRKIEKPTVAAIAKRSAKK